VAEFRFVTGYAKAEKSARENGQLTSVIFATEIDAVLQAGRISKFAELKRIPVCARLLARARLRLKLGAS